MDKTRIILLLALLQLFLFSTVADSYCCNGRNSEIESSSGCNRNCKSECDCAIQDCDSCQGSERCCQTCCNTQCNCQSVSCNSCSSSNECCSSCCNTKCRSSGCSARICRQCNCENCSSKLLQNTACCNSCCSESRVTEKLQTQPTNVSQITTLPNITIIINHAPIYVNNTPVINTEHRCGNASVLTNGTHIVYVYPQNSTCNNRTCCSRMVRPRCSPIAPQMATSCPPPLYISDCSPRCMYPPLPPPPPPMQVASQPCQYFMNWPFVHCPQTNCYGFSCAPPPMSMQMPLQMPVQMSMPMPVSMSMVQPAATHAGCIPLETWPFIRCVPGMNGESIVNYGPPSTQMVIPGFEITSIPFRDDHYGPGFADMSSN